MAQALLRQRQVPAEFWGEAMVTAVYILNRLSTKSLTGLTPYKAWYGRKPAVSHLRVFGCRAYAKEMGHTSKLADRSRAGVFLSYAEGAKAYRVLDPMMRRVHTARDVTFDEANGWDRGAGGEAQPTTEFIIEYHYEMPLAAAPATPMAAAAASPAASPPSVAAPASPMAAATSPATPHAPPVPTAPPPEFVTPLSQDDARLDVEHGESPPIRYRTYDNLLWEDEPVPGLAERNLDAELHLVSTGEPASFAEPDGDSAWRMAMQEEIDSIERNCTWELSDLPAGHRAITLKWVYKLKRNETGEVIKHKARLVARGFVQQEGIDFDEVFAPVARMESVRLLLALAAQEGWQVHHMDVKSTFLNGDLEEEVYVRQPAGFTVVGQEGKVLRLKKALYGLRQAPRAWNSKLDTTLR